MYKRLEVGQGPQQYSLLANMLTYVQPAMFINPMFWGGKKCHGYAIKLSPWWLPKKAPSTILKPF